jgi:branched-subunit amino acid transport protein
VKEVLSFIPAAILPAMIAPMVFFHQGEVVFLAGKERLAVLILATLVCYYTKNMLITIGFGLALLYLLTQN